MLYPPPTQASVRESEGHPPLVVAVFVVADFAMGLSPSEKPISPLFVPGLDGPRRAPGPHKEQAVANDRAAAQVPFDEVPSFSLDFGCAPRDGATLVVDLFCFDEGGDGDVDLIVPNEAIILGFNGPVLGFSIRIGHTYAINGEGGTSGARTKDVVRGVGDEHGISPGRRPFWGKNLL